MDYVSLHNHTTASILDSLIEPEDLFKRTKELGQKAVAITDHGTFAAAFDALTLSKKHGVKLIIGCEFYFLDDLNDKSARLKHVILIAKNHQGYKNILSAHFEGFDNQILTSKKVIPVISWEHLQKYSEGVICTTACSNGIISQSITSKNFTKAKEDLLKLKSIFQDDLAVELQPHGLKRKATSFSAEVDQTFINRQLLNLAKELDIKYIVATDAHYINPEDAEAHDVALAVSSGQPVESGQRLRYLHQEYDVPDFYIKSSEEVFNKIKRIIGEESAKIAIENTIYFSDRCEEPDWIDPKFSNPSKKELPEFPVKDQIDYDQFQEWNKINYIEGKSEDEMYLRFRTQLNYSKIPEGKEKEYLERLEEEFGVIEYHKFSSYLLIVMDYLEWARNNNISIGPGRGCVTKDTLVFKKNGFKPISDITTSDKVFSHTGKLRNVKNTFVYDCDEKLLEVKTNFGFQSIKYTKDHKVWAAKSINDKPSWIAIGDLNVKDFILMPIIKNDKDEYNKIIDLYNYTKSCKRKNGINYYHCDDNFIYGQKSNNQISCKRFINLGDKDFLYFLGRWVGDGCFHGKKNGVNVSFHKSDKIGIEKIKTILKSYGFNTGEYPSKNSNGFNLTIVNKLFAKFIKSLFKDYKSSISKHMPGFFRSLNKEQLEILLQGYLDADGYKKNNSCKTISYRLCLEIRELLLLKGNHSSTYVEIPKVPSWNKIYKTVIKKDNTSFKKNNHFYCKITSINEVSPEKVYDIEVEKDNSYLTSSYAVHNSVGGSLIAYLLNIHIADPIKYGLIFARFHNKEKKSFPDIDCDFSSGGRDKVQQYIENKYGSDYVAHVSNIMRMAPKPYVKSISRVFRYGGGTKEAVVVGNKIAEIIPKESKTLSSSFENSPLLVEFSKQYKEIEKYSKYLDKKIVAWSTHAAGIVIGKRKLKGLVPLRQDKERNVALELDKDQAEENGLIKMDLLGLETLDIIEKTYEIINSIGKEVKEFHYEEYDKKAYDLIASGKTLGVFQFGTSAGTIELCKRYLPTSIEDLAVITTIARPSSKDFRQDYIDRKDNKVPISYLHPRLEPVLKRTFGYCIYDESLLDMARHVAVWDYNQADVLRKMTKGKGKYSDKAIQWKNNFIQDCVKNSFTENEANDFWEKIILPFEKYSFNKSHAILYSFTSYKTAWLKAHYGLEYLCSCLMSEVKSNQKVAESNILKLKQEIRSLNVKIIPPDINTSLETYKIIDNETLMTGFDALKFMGKNAIPEILEKRPFTSLEDFLEKVDTRKVTSRAIQALAASGSLDSFGVSRKTIYLYAADFKKKYQAWLAKHKKNPVKHPNFKYPWPKEQDWSDAEKFSLEKLFLGEGLSGDKFTVFSGFFTRSAPSFKNLHKIHPRPEDNLSVAELRKYTKRVTMLQAEVKELYEFKVKKEESKIFGETMAKVRLEDPHGNQMVMTCFPEALLKLHDRISKLSNKKSKLEVGCGMYLTCDLSWYEDELSLLFIDMNRFCSPPQLPKDLTSKKINLRKLDVEEEIPEEKEEDRNFLLELIEDELIEEGNSDFEMDD